MRLIAILKGRHYNNSKPSQFPNCSKHLKSNVEHSKQSNCCLEGGIITFQNLAISKQFECLECLTFDFGHLELFGNCDGLLLL